MLVVYTQRALSIAGSKQRIEDDIRCSAGQLTNGVFAASFLGDDQFVRLVGVEPVCHTERGYHLQEELQWVAASGEVAKLRASTGADVVVLITGTSNYGGMALNNPSYRDPEDSAPWAFVVVEYFAFGTVFGTNNHDGSTIAHELGHLLEAAHDERQYNLPPVTPSNNFGYLHFPDEGVEPPYFRTLMSYKGFRNTEEHPTPNGAAYFHCTDCDQIGIFASPALFHIHSTEAAAAVGHGELAGHVCLVPDTSSYNTDCVCTSQGCSDGYVASDPGSPSGSEVFLLECRPLGTAHRFNNSETISKSVTWSDLEAIGVVAGTARNNNRCTVIDFLEIIKHHTVVPLPSAQCAHNCASLNRVSCTSMGDGCGVCSPGFGSSGGPDEGEACVPQLGYPSPFGDGSNCAAPIFRPSAVAVGIDHTDWTEHMHQLPGNGMAYDVTRVELQFVALDDNGDETWEWGERIYRSWLPPVPPSYEWRLYACTGTSSSQVCGTEPIADGTQSSPAGSVYAHSNIFWNEAQGWRGPTAGHAMVRLLWAASSASELLPQVTAFKVQTRRTADSEILNARQDGSNGRCPADATNLATCSYPIVPALWSVCGEPSPSPTPSPN